MKITHKADGVYVDDQKVKDLEQARQMYADWKAAQPVREKSEKKGPRKYRLVSLPDKKLSVQQSLVLSAISDSDFLSTEEITNIVVETGELITRQEPKRVVGFYVVEWLKAGILEKAA